MPNWYCFVGDASFSKRNEMVCYIFLIKIFHYNMTSRLGVK